MNNDASSREMELVPFLSRLYIYLYLPSLILSALIIPLPWHDLIRKFSSAGQFNPQSFCPLGVGGHVGGVGGLQSSLPPWRVCVQSSHKNYNKQSSSRSVYTHFACFRKRRLVESEKGFPANPNTGPGNAVGRGQKAKGCRRCWWA